MWFSRYASRQTDTLTTIFCTFSRDEQINKIMIVARPMHCAACRQAYTMLQIAIPCSHMFSENWVGLAFFLVAVDPFEVGGPAGFIELPATVWLLWIKFCWDYYYHLPNGHAVMTLPSRPIMWSFKLLAANKIASEQQKCMAWLTTMRLSLFKQCSKQNNSCSKTDCLSAHFKYISHKFACW